ncbi:LEAF RUST 10 DISEASE-RESISTANCE LOCUS RECEPTOR-LIKE PROTEIN KINASE-like 2.8 [Lotus japonicus]|uniref:LEAF RUST 10 DISEASE-RESISTANCE LOCUS RECEPTOR-LIKE PROTEIN KINASE-like 2.8 n=1 Tax=Lotus japonicus TaxID=34305 RepID=UPI00258B50E5|nr:LEAF RUST 10 DISEASE-RESISTANCE LOCUS RECEPTOR-LIKE PROTEIN KINASE-like 2.8 [Lotus japonicus]
MWRENTILLLLLLFQQNCLAANHHQPPCPPSSCGKLLNISYPFRLKTDPTHCGDRRYQLDCDTTTTGPTLTLPSGKFYVQEIDYKRFTLQLTDAGAVEDAACSFIPRNFLYQRSFKDFIGPDDFGSEPFVLSSHPPSIAYLNCSNSVADDDPRYVKVKVDTNRCGAPGYENVYAVVEPSVSDIRVGCGLVVATLGRGWRKGEIENGNVSYGDIHRMLVEGVTVSWLPVICEDRCGKRTRCEVVYDGDGDELESEGKVQCDKRYCHYTYHTTDKCGLSQQILGYTRAYLKGIIIGIGSRITFSTKQLGRPVDLQYFDEGVFIGRNILAPLIAAKYLFGVALLLALLLYKWRRRHLSVYENIEHFLVDSNLSPIRYEYKEIKKMTRGFNVKLGQGGFGSVYKGKLRSGLDVAIKMLTKSNANGQDFISEVATIGRIHHINVVRLVGYCVDGKKRALVYEFMPNGSLDKYIFSKEGSAWLSYDQIYEISLGIARGVAYLHQGCDMQILHFDIKPHNILLDKDFIPKVSDFGLAKLYNVNDSIVTLTAARGTLGYMAPELFYKNIGGVSYKADVYSFGMLLMEMAGRRRNSNPHAEHSSQQYFPFWIYDQFQEGKDVEMEEYASEEGKALAKKIFMVALWCVQFKPSDRPSMKKVVEMLEGPIESLEMPPARPSFYPSETFKHDGGSNSDRTSWSGSTSSDRYLGETLTNQSLENSA